MSRLPEADRVVIEDRKLNEYLLSTEHPFGRSKARFFLDLGFRKGATEPLLEALRRHAAESNITESEETDFGSKYVVQGPLIAPDGRIVDLRSVWFVETGQTAPRFVTAYPWKGVER
jgi:uncharacterized protein DUF6883